MILKKVQILLLGCALSMGFITGCGYDSTASDGSAQNQEAAAKAETLKEDKKANPKYDELVDKINSVTNKDSAQYSVYIDFLDGTQPIEVNSQQIRSASMIKVFIMAKAYEDIKDGKFSENQELVLKDSDKVGGAGSLVGWPTGSKITVHELLKLMITESDNTATNMMIDLLGMDNINQYIREHGYSDSLLQRKMMDTQAVKEGRENLTSSHDLGQFFTLLYNKKIISAEYDDKMIDLLKQQTDTECLPQAIKNVPIAHKTGELDHLYHDGGIVYNGDHPFVVCILTENQLNRTYTLINMRRIAKFINQTSKEN